MKSFSSMKSYFGKGDKDSAFPKGAKVHHFGQGQAAGGLSDYPDTNEKITEMQNVQGKMMQGQKPKAGWRW